MGNEMKDLIKRIGFDVLSISTGSISRQLQGSTVQTLRGKWGLGADFCPRWKTAAGAMWKCESHEEAFKWSNMFE